jgi:hypothetical protein
LQANLQWDVLHGCRGMGRDAFFLIDPLPKGVSMDLEMVVRSYRYRLRAIEFPVAERPRLSGTTRFKAWPTGKALLRYFATEFGKPVPSKRRRIPLRLHPKGLHR